MKELEALERINKRFGIFSLDDISDFYLINEALTELEELKSDVISDLDKHKSAHDKLIEMGLRLKVTKNYADGVFSHEWWNDNDDRVIVFYIDEKVTTVYEGNNEIMAIIPQYLEELE